MLRKHTEMNKMSGLSTRTEQGRDGGATFVFNFPPYDGTRGAIGTVREVRETRDAYVSLSYSPPLSGKWAF